MRNKKTYSCGRMKYPHDTEKLGLYFSCECGRVHYTGLDNDEKKVPQPAKKWNSHEKESKKTPYVLVLINQKRSAISSKFSFLSKKLIAYKIDLFVRIKVEFIILKNSYKKWWFFISNRYGLFKPKSLKARARLHSEPDYSHGKSSHRINFSNLPSSKEERLKGYMNELIRVSWPRDAYKNADYFLLRPSKLMQMTINDAAKMMIHHVQNVAPGFKGLNKIPAIRYSKAGEKIGGHFETNNIDYSAIVISSRYSNNMQASLAVLSHELCHFILERAGIRETNVTYNEYLTDVCMFVVGFGNIFRSGFRQSNITSDGEYRSQLGYLSYEDYETLADYVLMLRLSGSVASTISYKVQTEVDLELLKMERSLLNIFRGDSRKVEEHITYYTRKFQGKPRKWVIEKILLDFQRDKK